MGGVDRADKRIIMYSTARKSLKWYSKLICHIIDVFVANANVLFNLITLMGLDMGRMAQVQKGRARTRRQSEFLRPCPSQQQMPKHVFMRHIIEESIAPLRKALKDTHRRTRYHSSWYEWTSEGQASEPLNAYNWVRYIDDKQVRLTSNKIPEQHRATPDKRVTHGQYKTKK